MILIDLAGALEILSSVPNKITIINININYIANFHEGIMPWNLIGDTGICSHAPSEPSPQILMNSTLSEHVFRQSSSGQQKKRRKYSGVASFEALHDQSLSRKSGRKIPPSSPGQEIPLCKDLDCYGNQIPGIPRR
jgi:hypothetical protein